MTWCYTVLPPALVDAARAVSTGTDAAKVATIEYLPKRVIAFGDDTLEGAVADFCARWDAGLGYLIGDSEAMAEAREECAGLYLDTEQDAAAGYTAAPPGRPAAHRRRSATPAHQLSSS